MEQEQVLLHSAAQFKALGHPMRQRMMNVLRQRPATLAELAAALGSTKGTIAYHVRVLRKGGLLRLAYTRQVRGGTEQYFARVAGDFRLPPEGGAEFLLKEALGEVLPTRPGQAEHTVLKHLWLTPRQAEALAVRIAEFAAEQAEALAVRIAEFAAERERNDSAHGEPYGLLLSLYPADIPALPPDSPS